MKTVIVTGAGGYIGSVLVPMLLEKGYRVKTVDRFFFGKDKIPNHKNLLLIQEDTRRLGPDIFYGAYAVIDLVAISNDPSGDLFPEQTWQINYESRVRTVHLAKRAGVERYILPSSCSVYGFQENIVDETSPTNPLTVYAKANLKCEEEVLKLSNKDFCVVIFRLATVFGYSPRMRLDLALNGMTYGAFVNKKLPLMRDGSQYRPLVHIKDVVDAICYMLEIETDRVNGERFNIGRNENNYQIIQLGEIVSKLVSEALGEEVPIEWYGDPDVRSYRVDFSKIEKITGWRAKYGAEDGVKEMIEKIKSGELKKTPQTITLEWYKELTKWHKIIKEVEMYGGILEI